MKSKLLAHRGCWANISQQAEFPKNSFDAIHKAAELGFGLETDIRDSGQKIVISHDPPGLGTTHFETNLDFVELFEAPVALNVKADGLTTHLLEMPSNRVKADNVFFFDMSFPESLKYRASNLPIAERVSEFESLSPLGSPWVWVDRFESDWLEEEVYELVQCWPNRKFCVVSPELHGRNPKTVWGYISKLMVQSDSVYLCTDFPELFLNEFV